jgi:hypothetical protein
VYFCITFRGYYKKASKQIILKFCILEKIKRAYFAHLYSTYNTKLQSYNQQVYTKEKISTILESKNFPLTKRCKRKTKIAKLIVKSVAPVVFIKKFPVWLLLF